MPVARWRGPRFGAVLSLFLRMPDEEDDDPEDPYPDSEIELFRRSRDGWEIASGSGGSNWHEPPFQRPNNLHPDEVWFLGEACAGEDGWFACGIDGVAGRNAAVVEVEDADGVTIAAIESAFGAFVVAVDGVMPAMIRVRGVNGRLLAEELFEGHDLGPL